MKSKIYFRADGNSKMGLGHVFRSLALAEMLQFDFECHFIIRTPLPTLKKQILNICQSVTELPETNNGETEAETLVTDLLIKTDIVVLDGYHFRTEYQRILKNKNIKLVCIDDIYAYPFLADIIINHAGGLTSAEYSAEAYTQFLLGLKYALLRKPFRKAAKCRQTEIRNSNVFVCLGGADPNNDTLEVINACLQHSEFNKIHVVIGAAYQYRETIEQLASTVPNKIAIFNNLTADQLVACMQKCSTAITSPSTIAYEYLSVGGLLHLKVIADNQKNINRYFLTSGLAFSFDDLPLKEGSKIQKALALQEKHFDGGQQKRLINIFKSLTLKIRRATVDDYMLYYEWANDPYTRDQSYNAESIHLEKHIEWFKNKINTPNSILYVVELKNNPIGQIRFDQQNKEVIISYSLDKNFRGQGLGVGLLRSGIAQFRKEFGANLPIIGFVKSNNIPSVKAFRSIGFKEENSRKFKESFKYIMS